MRATRRSVMTLLYHILWASQVLWCDREELQGAHSHPRTRLIIELRSLVSRFPTFVPLQKLQTHSPEGHDIGTLHAALRLHGRLQ